MPSPARKRKAAANEPILGLSTHLNIKIREEILKRLGERRKNMSEFLLDEIEKEVVEEFKKKYRQK